MLLQLLDIEPASAADAWPDLIKVMERISLTSMGVHSDIIQASPIDFNRRW